VKSSISSSHNYQEGEYKLGYMYASTSLSDKVNIKSSILHIFNEHRIEFIYIFVY